MWFSEGLTFCLITTRVPQILPLILCLSYLTDNHILLFGAGCVSDTMTKARFDCIGHLVTKGAFSSDKVDLSKSMTLFFFLNFSYIVYVFQCDSIQGHFNDTVKAQNKDFVVKGKPDSIFREQGLTGIK